MVRQQWLLRGRPRHGDLVRHRHPLVHAGHQAGQRQPRRPRGHQLALGGNWSITPQAQLAWSQVRFDAFTDQYGASVSRDNGNSLVSRLGVSLDHETKWTAANGKTQRSHVYGITNLYYDFLHGTSARVADISVVSKEQALWAGLGVGASMNWDDDRYTVYGEALVRTSLQNFGDGNAIGAKLGFRYRW